MIKKLFVAVTIVIIVAGCGTTEQLARNLAEKDMAGSGFFAKQKIGLDDTTQTPTLESLIVSGDFKTIKADSNFIDFSKEETGAWYNAENKTLRTRLTATCTKDTDFVEVLRLSIELEKLKQLSAETPDNTTGATVGQGDAEITP